MTYRGIAIDTGLFIYKQIWKFAFSKNSLPKALKVWIIFNTSPFKEKCKFNYEKLDCEWDVFHLKPLLRTQAWEENDREGIKTLFQ